MVPIWLFASSIKSAQEPESELVCSECGFAVPHICSNCGLKSAVVCEPIAHCLQAATSMRLRDELGTFDTAGEVILAGASRLIN
jgi:predicted amidophosphoribosyltransferase